ncbi:glycoside hydrolase family 127 protein [Niabella pedocola]|uniref:Glycoside hydrolase family 127 protein n=1 Tax=Niabella pedocola TaxID=1752077 RepID=A0ABS8PVY0_9BACT|nr:beta-L-arabinofuranosidase domain-containing protein [Niabella pedocola]MCD2425233.1 glycoside hydrolase family 127 protein [Niabella pedocola]
MSKKEMPSLRLLSRRTFVKQTGMTAVAGVLAPGLVARQAGSTGGYLIANRFETAGTALLQGYMGSRLDQCFQNDILTKNFDHLIGPFRHRTETHRWQSEFWGKCMMASVLAYQYKPDPRLKAKMDAAVTGLIATQTPDGYIGNYNAESRLKQWDIWGMKYCLLGLLDYHDLTGDKKSLYAAVKLADYLMAQIDRQGGIIVNKGNYRGMAASSVLLPMVRLSVATGNRKYRSFAETIVKQWETPGGPQLISKAAVNVAERFPRPKEWYSPEQGQKAYEMMSCYEGLLALYRLTGNETYKQAVVHVFKNIQDTEINIAGSGASAEMWFGGRERQTTPVFHYQETCVTVTWMQLCMALLKLTGEAIYAHAIETTYYNALMAALKSDGFTWAKYTPLNGERLPGSGQCGMELNCCSANGPRGLFAMPGLVAMRSREGIAVNFFAEGTTALTSPAGKPVKLVQTTNYPASGKIAIRLEMQAPEDMVLQLRIPEWSRQTILQVNGVLYKDVVSGIYVNLKRKWNTGDMMLLELDMRGRVKVMGKQSQYFAVLTGPLVLSRDTRFTGTNLGTVITPLKENEPFIDLKKVAIKADDSWLQVEAMFQAENYKEQKDPPVVVTLCDYATAGNGAAASTFQTWMPLIFNAAKLE